MTYFVTFRTADSLPQEKLQLWQSERDAWLRNNPEPHDAETRAQFHQLFSDRIHYWLDLGAGGCVLRSSVCRQVVVDALLHFNGERYDIDEFVVMPNHVHAIATPRAGFQLSGIVHSWKSFTAKQINQLTGTQGAFWQKEAFDHVIRTPEQLEQIRRYIRDHSAETAQ